MAEPNTSHSITPDTVEMSDDEKYLFDLLGFALIKKLTSVFSCTSNFIWEEDEGVARRFCDLPERAGHQGFARLIMAHLAALGAKCYRFQCVAESERMQQSSAIGADLHARPHLAERSGLHEHGHRKALRNAGERGA